MKIREMVLEDLELLSYTDIAYSLLKEDNEKMTTSVLFKEICKLLKIKKPEMEEQIGDFYATLSTDRRFTLIDSIYWDLKSNHIVRNILEEDLGEDIIEEDFTDEDEIDVQAGTEDEEVEGDIVDEDYGDDDGLDGLVIVREEEIEE